MNKKRIYLVKHLSIIALSAMLLSFIPEKYPSLFGDWKCGGYQETGSYQNRVIVNAKCNYEDTNHLPKLHWGFRHWVWFFTGLFLCVSNLIFVIHETDNIE